jgi:hypothetical protein
MVRGEEIERGSMGVESRSGEIGRGESGRGESWRGG